MIDEEVKASQNSGLEFNGRRTSVKGLVISGYLFMLGWIPKLGLIYEIMRE